VRAARRWLFWGASPTYVPSDDQATTQRLVEYMHRNGKARYARSLVESVRAGDSMLFMAVSRSNLQMIAALSQYHDYGQPGQHTEVVCLCLAVKYGDEAMVRRLIELAHINPNDRVQIGCNHCKSNASDEQRFQFPLYGELDILSLICMYVVLCQIQMPVE
jgi:hypothetical protein